MQVNKIVNNKNAVVRAKAQNKLHIARLEAKRLSRLVTELQSRLDRLEELKSAGSDPPPPE